MRIAIVDDEQSLIRLASHTIKDFGKMKHLTIEIDEFLDGQSFLDQYETEKYSIVFMDVYMPILNGIDTVMKLRDIDVNVTVIFLTTSESHMKNALSCHAFDYLVKPATRADFFKVLEECVLFLGNSVVDSSKYLEFIAQNLEVKVSSNQIIAAISNGHSVTIITNEISYDAKETFQVIADNLANCKNFLLINRGILVNMDYVDKIEEGCCYLSNGDSYYIKVKANRQILQAFQDYRQSRA